MQEGGKGATELRIFMPSVATQLGLCHRLEKELEAKQEEWRGRAIVIRIHVTYLADMVMASSMISPSLCNVSLEPAAGQGQEIKGPHDSARSIAMKRTHHKQCRGHACTEDHGKRRHSFY